MPKDISINIRDMIPGDVTRIGDKRLYRDSKCTFIISDDNNEVLQSNMTISEVFEYFRLNKRVLSYSDYPAAWELYDQDIYVQRCGNCGVYFSGPIIFRDMESDKQDRTKYWCPVCESWWIESNYRSERRQEFARYQVLTAIKDIPGSTQAELLRYIQENMIGFWYKMKISRCLSELVNKNRVILNLDNEYWFNDEINQSELNS